MRNIAHRGFSSRAPENTMAAFVAAVEFGVDGIELDVHMSKDGVLVVCHDESVDRTTNGSGLLKDMTYAQIEQLDAGTWFDLSFRGERVPSLRQLLDYVKDRHVLVNIEIKFGSAVYPGIEEQVVALVHEYTLADFVIVSSFDHDCLARIKAMDRGMPTGALYMANLYQPWNYAKTIPVDALHPYFPVVSTELIQACQANGIQVNPFTVDGGDDILRLWKAGVDGIITNVPDRVEKVATP